MSSRWTEPGAAPASAVASARRAGSYPVGAAPAGMRTVAGGSGWAPRADAGGPMGAAGAVGAVVAGAGSGSGEGAGRGAAGALRAGAGAGRGGVAVRAGRGGAVRPAGAGAAAAGGAVAGGAAGVGAGGGSASSGSAVGSWGSGAAAEAVVAGAGDRSRAEAPAKPTPAATSPMAARAITCRPGVTGRSGPAARPRAAVVRP